jgi:hypothetical protein
MAFSLGRRFHGALLEELPLRLVDEASVESQPQLGHPKGVTLCQRLAQMLDRWVVPLAAVFDGTQFDPWRNNNNVVPDVNWLAAHRYGLLRNAVQDQLYGVLVRVPGMLQVAQQLIIPLLPLELPLPGFTA